MTLCCHLLRLKIFEYTEKKLQLPHDSIKATVLIENIFAAFEMDEILFELRHHSSGLNCGMWDYTASIVVNFATDPIAGTMTQVNAFLIEEMLEKVLYEEKLQAASTQVH
ncbi:unnamed protein product [Peronospora belbahrii]|uniref:malate synthase n=1 Tax=Peronospora belbahrii TaxID=622444 RepID=A0ABN8D7V0_9STRA|nr:unnamed protein product [Peronospora belbahrii]